MTSDIKQVGQKQGAGHANQVHFGGAAKANSHSVKAPITPGLQPALPPQLASSMQQLKPGHTSHPAKVCLFVSSHKVSFTVESFNCLDVPGNRKVFGLFIWSFLDIAHER